MGRPGRRTGPAVRRPRRRRGRGGRGVRRRGGDLDLRRCASQSRWVVDDDGHPPCHRSTAARVQARRQARGGPDAPRRHPAGGDGGGRRRPPPARVHLLPPHAVHGGTGGAHPAARRGPHRRRDRPGLPRARDDDGAADHPREDQDQGRARALPGADGRRHRAAPRRGARRRLPHLQRALPRRLRGGRRCGPT